MTLLIKTITPVFEDHNLTLSVVYITVRPTLLLY